VRLANAKKDAQCSLQPHASIRPQLTRSPFVFGSAGDIDWTIWSYSLYSHKERLRVCCKFSPLRPYQSGEVIEIANMVESCHFSSRMKCCKSDESRSIEPLTTYLVFPPLQEMDDDRDCDAVIDHCDGMIFGGVTIRVSFAEREPNFLPHQHDDIALSHTCQACGGIGHTAIECPTR
jgi:hypothetical protein